MSKVVHPYFGNIDAGAVDSIDVIWEREFTLGGSTFDVSLWAGPESNLGTSVLDAFAGLLSEVTKVDLAARQSLCHYLKEDRFYIDDFVENVEESEVLKKLGDDPANVSAEMFVAQMKLCGIGLWVEVARACIVLDYMIDQDTSDQILAVKMDSGGAVVAVDWES